jgi:hypothetical protein
MLPFDDPSAWMTAEFWSKAFEDRFTSRYDLQEKRIAIGADK